MITCHKINNPQVAKTYFEKTQNKPHCVVQFSDLNGNASSFIAKEHISSLYLDPGALSGNNGKGQVDSLSYGQFLKLYGSKFNQVFTPVDNFTDPEQQVINHFCLQDGLQNGLKLIPIILNHNHENPSEEIETYIECGHDYMAIQLDQAVYTDDVIKKMAEHYPNVRFHVFGELNVNMLVKFKPYSADTSAMNKKAGKEIIYFWHPEENELVGVFVGGGKKHPKWTKPYETFEYRAQLDEILSQTLNYSLDAIKKDKYARQVVNMYAFQQMEQYITSLVQEMAPPQDDAANNLIQANLDQSAQNQASQAQA